MKGENETRHQPRPPEDPFDTWVHLVGVVIIEPILDLLRVAWNLTRGAWAQLLANRQRRPEARRMPRRGRP